jgi:hypothetical protein
MAETTQRTAQVRQGGNFAPPLSDEKLADYKARVAAMPASPIKDALAGLLKCCGVWWDLPEPQGTRTWDHPSGKGTVVTLQDDHKATLDPHIPWDHELDALGGAPDGKLGLFDLIDADAAARNSQKVSAWTTSVLGDLVRKHLAGADPEQVYKALKAAEQLAASLPGLLTDDQKAQIAQLKAGAMAFDAAARAAISTKTYSDLPYPPLESTATRDMAFHLLWHVREFNLGREPITTDRL